jgi:type I restriction enzyme M protein
LKVPNVSENDTLLNENLWQHTFDIIVANPPFITPKGGARRHSRFAITSNKTEVLFCEYMVHHLNFNGRMGVIVPEGIIFDGSKGHQAIRKLFLDNGLWCVVSLPSGVFNPYSGKKTNIIFLDKTLKPENILFYEIKNHGFSLTTNPSPVKENDIPNTIEILKSYRSDLQNGKQKTFNEISYFTLARADIVNNKSLNLTGSTYRTIKRTKKKWQLVRVNEVAEIGSGNSAPQEKKLFENGKFPFFRTSDVGAVHISDNLISSRDNLNEAGIKGLKLFPKNTILFPKSGASTFLNHRAMLGVSGYVSSHLATIIPDEAKIIPSFLFHILLSIDARSLTNDQDYPSLKTSDVGNIIIPLPSIKDQQKIMNDIERYNRENREYTEKIAINKEKIGAIIKSIYG